MLVEKVDGFGILLRDMAVAHVLAYDTGVFALSQGVAIAMTSTRFGLLDAQFIQQLGHIGVDVFGAIV